MAPSQTLERMRIKRECTEDAHAQRNKDDVGHSRTPVVYRHNLG
ncbi:hypothetical protein FB480_1077 [Agrobacterium vitis]|nr:hypothetical protein FB480_1077 [Agrobacterium vitis]